jgi:hypothetical protein
MWKFIKDRYAGINEQLRMELFAVVSRKTGDKNSYSSGPKCSPEKYMKMCDALQELNAQCIIERYKIPEEKFINLNIRKDKIFKALHNAKGVYQRVIHKAC